ncbi:MULTISPECIES: IMPACT family protein [Cetobacterium]|uniref:IMPACT family protein n=1 Tax=Cetobacterium TaxID=180162 RepID=UPI00163B9B1D|nr:MULTISPECIES: YigZ family protein [Cetobacterium]MBC2852989.1 YigZ family protein [Cetobacterium sp. 2G large]WVJ01167.1 YigZ family protein [Cetobacterium somerae]
MKSIKKAVRIEFEERKSKFIGYAKPISTKEEAEDFISMIREMHPDATHNCTVYRVIDNGQEYFKADDDGEPSGTAGKPMGEILTYMEVNNVVVVATRYFGGIKLGAGGLVRNYAKTAKLAVLEGEIVEFIERVECLLDFSYEKINEVETLLINGNEELLNKDFNERVTYRVKVSNETLEKLKELKDILVIM